jgi:NitT/TauT family transport system permease protein
MQRWRLAESGLLPWIVVSQTVPLIAFAPLVASIGTQIDRGGTPWPQWLSVAVIASYLAFFPVAVGVLRGLEAPDRIHLDLMRSYAVGYWPTLLRLRLPAAVPHLLPALRLAAANAVVGAVVAEVSIGMRGGIGRMLIQLAGQGSSDPAAPWGPTFGSIALGLVAAASVALLGLGLKNYRRGEATA